MGPLIRFGKLTCFWMLGSFLCFEALAKLPVVWSTPLVLTEIILSINTVLLTVVLSVIRASIKERRDDLNLIKKSIHDMDKSIIRVDAKLKSNLP